MKVIVIILLATICPSSAPLFASAVKDTIEGVWKGTSICQVKNSPCYDEEVVYHISKAAGPNSYTILMNKIVNGKEEEMGALNCTYDAVKNTLTGKTVDRRNREGFWLFTVSGNKIKGTLTIEGKILYRVIDVTKY